ncbi:uncharacterized protein LOC143838708 [Paroedura picta]|uniref:uncharacterized protein LOC143838708 n=1 Tax=Paroedura picta TaxID=143630 RepID=UPI0040571680
MSDGGLPEAGGSFIPWMRGGSMRLRDSGMRVGTKLGEPDEDTKSWAGYERRHHMVLQPKDPMAMKGPAFWSKSATPQQLKARAQWHRRYRRPMPDADACLCPGLRRVVYTLVTFALLFFFATVCLVFAYIFDSTDLDSFMVRLGGQQQRLIEAMQTFTSGQSMHCVPCQKDWMQMADTCYLFTTEKMPWNDCIDHCISEKASFLIGKTEGEMDFVRLETRRRMIVWNNRVVPGYYWIGLMYNQTAWFWADGAHLHIRMSTTDKLPSVFEKYCVMFHNGHEDNVRCEYKNHCLCKRKAS